MVRAQHTQAARSCSNDSFTVNCGGDTFDQTDPKGLEFISVEDHVKMIGMCELTFVAGRDESAWKSMTVGSDVEVWIGSETQRTFKGTISGLRHRFERGNNRLTVTAMDPLVKLACSRSTHVYKKKHHSFIATKVIERAKAIVGTVDLTPEVHPYTLQRNESDLRFLRRLAAQNHRVLMATDGKIDFKKPQTSGESIEIPKTRLIALDYAFTPREVPKQVTTIGWDFRKKQTVIGTATKDDLTHIGRGDTAADGKLFSGDATISDVWVETQVQAKEFSESQLNASARNFLKGRATVEGDRTLRSGQMVHFVGHPKGFNAEAFVLSSRPRVRARGGYTTELVLCSNTYPT